MSRCVRFKAALTLDGLFITEPLSSQFEGLNLMSRAIPSTTRGTMSRGSPVSNWIVSILFRHSKAIVNVHRSSMWHAGFAGIRNIHRAILCKQILRTPPFAPVLSMN